MHMSRSGIAVVGAVVCILLLALVLPKPKIQEPQLVDGDRMAKALAQYIRDAATRGESPPSSVTLDALVQKGYLTPQNVKPFEEAKVTFYAGALETRPQSVLCSAEMPDGTIQVILADGSVQGLTRGRWQQYLANLGAANRSQAVRPETNTTSEAVGSGR